LAYFSPATREITAKIVYYGPGMCGKTTNLQKVHELMKPQMRSDLLSVATETDRTIYFDFMPLKLGKIAGFDFVVRTFTVPGQPYYAETRKMVLQGADGVVFVADSQRYMLDQNKDSLMDLKRNLSANNLDYFTIPMVLQYNKRDLPDILSIEDMDAMLNSERQLRSFAASAYQGTGVIETLQAVTMAVFKHVRDQGMKKNKPKKKPQPAGMGATTSPGSPAVQVGTSSIPGAAPVQSGVMPAAPRPAPAAPPAPTVPSTQSAVTQSPAAAPMGGASASTPLDQIVGTMVQGSQVGESPMPDKDSIGIQEFQNLAVLQHKLQERVAQLDQELKKLSQEHADLKRLVGRKLMG
jgi:signal recognition particle receptor subunit beta